MRLSPARQHLVAIALFVALAAPLRVATADDTPSKLATARNQISKSLGHVASGLEHGLATQDVRVAVRLHKIEQRATDLLIRTANTSYAAPENKVRAMNDTRAMLSRIYNLQTRTLEHAVNRLDQVLPGEPGRQNWARSGRDLYHPLFRSSTPGQQHGPSGMDRFREMLRDFREKGGKDSDFRYLGKRSLAKLQSGKLVEWVQFGKDKIRFTGAGAKHPVIGKGRSVRGAGSMKIYKDAKGEVVLAVVSNASGNYKPAHSSTEGVVQRLRGLGVPASRILVTKVTPTEADNVKLLLKASGMPKDAIKARIARLREGKALGKLPKITGERTKPVKAKPAKTKPAKTKPVRAKPVLRLAGKRNAPRLRTTGPVRLRAVGKSPARASRARAARRDR